MAITKASLRRIVALCEHYGTLYGPVKRAFEALPEGELSPGSLGSLTSTLQKTVTQDNRLWALIWPVNCSNHIFHSILRLLIKWPANIRSVEDCFNLFEELQPKFAPWEIKKLFDLFDAREGFSSKLASALLILKTDLKLFTAENVYKLIDRRERASFVTSPEDFSLSTSNITHAEDLARAFVLLASIVGFDYKLRDYLAIFSKNPIDARSLAECIYLLHQISPRLYEDEGSSVFRYDSAEQLQNMRDFAQYIVIAKNAALTQNANVQLITEEEINSLKELLKHISVRKLAKFCKFLHSAKLLTWVNISKVIFYMGTLEPNLFNIYAGQLVDITECLVNTRLLNQENLELLLKVVSCLYTDNNWGIRNAVYCVVDAESILVTLITNQLFNKDNIDRLFSLLDHGVRQNRDLPSRFKNDLCVLQRANLLNQANIDRFLALNLNNTIGLRSGRFSEWYRGFTRVLEVVQRANLLNQANFEQLIEHTVVLTSRDVIYSHDDLSSVPPHLFTQTFFNGLIQCCQQHPTDLAAAGEACRLYLHAILHPPVVQLQAVLPQAVAQQAVVNRLASSQSTHITSVHKSSSDSARRLKHLYTALPEGRQKQIDDTLALLYAWLQKPITLEPPKDIPALEAERTEAQKKSIELVEEDRVKLENMRVIAIRGYEYMCFGKYRNEINQNRIMINYVDAASGVSLGELISYLWLAVHDEVDPKSDSLRGRVKGVSLINAQHAFYYAFYEFVRAYNLDEHGKDSNWVELDLPSCAPGAFNKFVEAFSCLVRAAQQLVLTPEQAAYKLAIVAREEAVVYLKRQEAPRLQELLDILRQESTLEPLYSELSQAVVERMWEEFRSVYVSDDLQSCYASLENLTPAAGRDDPQVILMHAELFVAHPPDGANLDSNLLARVIQQLKLFKALIDSLRYCSSEKVVEAFSPAPVAAADTTPPPTAGAGAGMWNTRRASNADSDQVTAETTANGACAEGGEQVLLVKAP